MVRMQPLDPELGEEQLAEGLSLSLASFHGAERETFSVGALPTALMSSRYLDAL